MLVKRPTWAYTSFGNYIIIRRCCSCRCWSFDQKPSLGVLLSIAEITLIQRFACWSKDQHGLILQMKIISSAAVVGLAVVGLAVVGLIDQQPNLAVLLSIAEITLIQRFACWSKRPTWA